MIRSGRLFFRGGSRGVRARASGAAVGVLALALASGGALLLALLNHALVSAVDAGALSRADTVVQALQDSGPSAVEADLTANPPVGQVVQVLDGSGRVVAASNMRGSAAPLTDLRPGPGTVQRSEADKLFDIDDPYLFFARGVTRGGRPYVVIVAASLETARESVRTVLLLLAGGAPLLLLLTGAATWVLTGRSLAPVERIREQVAQISARRLDGRVPVPRSRDEIASLATTMNRMLDRLENAHTVQRQFVSDASHEMRSPLATLVAALEVAGEHPDGELWARVRPVLAAESSRMSRLVADLLLLARSDDEGIRLRVADIDLDELVWQEASRVRLAGLVRVAARPGPTRVRGDESRLGQLVRNLSDNAARHAASTIAVRSVSDSQGSRLVVEDDGPGIPEADRARVFDRFVRLEPDRGQDTGGSGLGLAIVREIARAHGATVDIDTSPLGGARVTVRFPDPVPPPS